MRQLAVAISSIFFAVSAAVSGYAQEESTSALVFDREIWDFGRIEELDGPVSCVFTFTNSGKEPVVLERVSVSCGCTTPEYTQKPVLPGEKGEIKITFDPADRPGAFVKYVYITSGGGKNRDKIAVRGDVNPRPKSIEEDYPYRLGGGLRLKRLDANFSYVEKDKPTSMAVGYVNTSDKPVKLDFAVLPASANVTVSALPTICAGCKGDMTITYDMRGSEVYGRQSHKVGLVVNGKRETLGISTTAIIVDNFTPGDAAEGASMKLIPAYKEVKEVADGSELKVEFLIRNEGSQVLIIRAVQPRKTAVANIEPGTEIAPGKSETVKVTVKAVGSKGDFFADGVYITTNDPTFPMREFRVMGEIK